MLQAISNISWKQQHKQPLYDHLPPITKTIQISRTRYAGHSWRSKDELISDVFLWTPSHGRASVCRLIRAYLQQFFTDTRCSLEDLPEATVGKSESGKSVQAARCDDEVIFLKDIRDFSSTKEILFIERHVFRDYFQRPHLSLSLSLSLSIYI